MIGVAVRAGAPKAACDASARERSSQGARAGAFQPVFARPLKEIYFGKLLLRQALLSPNTPDIPPDGSAAIEFRCGAPR